MKLSPERVSFLARQMTERLKATSGIEVRTRTTQMTAAILRAFREVLLEDEQIEAKAKDKIRSLSRPVPKGSEEWQILFQQYYEEELKKHGGHEGKWR